jgi:threonylcarbamoyladenosine tRNA methylthiotransferase MtaB
MKAGFYTLGCKLNQCETEALADAFRRAGYEAAGADEEAALYIINTCTVTSKSEQKARRVLRGILSRSGAPVILTGCYAELDRAGLEAEFEGRVFILGAGEKAKLLELPAFLEARGVLAGQDCRPALAAFCGQKTAPDGGNAFNFQAGRYSFHTRAFLKIQDGCDMRCAYCRVPLARGPSRSLDADEVIHRFRRLETGGYREIVLTGVNLMSYRCGQTDFAGLLERILVSAGGEARVRISSLEPDGMTARLVRVLANPLFCPHFHLPVQSGSDAVLAAMGRRYTRQTVVDAARLLRDAREAPFLAADIITGFPGETEDDHRQTETLVRQLDFAGLHVFPYSPRPGTAAYTRKNRVPERLARERAASLREIAAGHRKAYAARLSGQTLDVLIEKSSPGGGWEGLSANYMTVRGRDTEGPMPVPGARVSVRVESAGDDFLAATEIPRIER